MNIHKKMERYRFISEIGDGSCGKVYKAINLQTNEIVAVKKMKRKFHPWEDFMNLREVRSLCSLNHPNIVKLLEIVRQYNELFFIFEYMENNLCQIIIDRQTPFAEVEIRNFMSQILEGLAYMHRTGYFHRDLKPENLLVTDDVVKIADFGLAREVISKPPFTEYVSTRWYRAPEVLFQSPSYTPAIDMWAIGAILAELFMRQPLFSGESEMDQLYKICFVLGTPNFTTWPEGFLLSKSVNFDSLHIPPANLYDIIPTASHYAIDLIKQLCSWDPLKRLTAEQALNHPFFHVDNWIPYSLEDRFHTDPNRAGDEPKLELNLLDYSSQSDDCFLALSLGGVRSSLSDIDHQVSQTAREGVLFCSESEEQLGQLVFFPLLSHPDDDVNDRTLSLF